MVGESLIGVPCPLTVWEAQLRKMAGQTGYTGDFLGYWAHRLIFFRADPWVFTLIYTLFGLAVLVAFILAPPRRSRAAIDPPCGPLDRRRNQHLRWNEDNDDERVSAMIVRAGR